VRVLVCGSRTYPDEMFVWSVLSGLYQAHDVGWQVDHLTPFIVISGGATGADSFAKSWCENSPLHGPLLGRDKPNYDDRVTPVQHLEFPADWRKHGNAAGPIRNKQQLVEGQPELGLAFIDKPLLESRGTHDMVRRLIEAGVLAHILLGQFPPKPIPLQPKGI